MVKITRNKHAFQGEVGRSKHKARVRNGHKAAARHWFLAQIALLLCSWFLVGLVLCVVGVLVVRLM